MIYEHRYLYLRVLYRWIYHSIDTGPGVTSWGCQLKWFSPMESSQGNGLNITKHVGRHLIVMSTELLMCLKLTICLRVLLTKHCISLLLLLFKSSGQNLWLNLPMYWDFLAPDHSNGKPRKPCMSNQMQVISCGIIILILPFH